MTGGTLTAISAAARVEIRRRTYVAPPAGPDPALRMLVVEPCQAAPAATVVVAHHRDGIDGFTTAVCTTLAGAGFRAVAPDLFSRITETGLTPAERKARLRDAELLRDLARCRALAPDGGPMGIVGHCMGGRVALLAAVFGDDFGAAVSFYGGNPFRAWGEGEPPGERIGDVRCPLLLVGGRGDTNPSPEDLRRLAIGAAAAPHPVEVAVAEDAGHAFMNFNRPEVFRPVSTQLGYATAVAFLARHLTGTPKERT
jgi:carboxymethylenebutenolidase